MSVCVCVCGHIYIHSYIHTYIHTYIYIYIYNYLYIYLFIYIHICIHIHIFSHIFYKYTYYHKYSNIIDFSHLTYEALLKVKPGYSVGSDLLLLIFWIKLAAQRALPISILFNDSYHIVTLPSD